MNKHIGYYNIEKTLRFELRPIGKTKENIVNNKILLNDKYKTKIYEDVKLLLDEYYKVVIDETLKKVNFEEKLLKESLNNKDANDKLKKIIISSFQVKVSKNETLSKTLTSESVLKLLKEYLIKENRFDDVKIVDEFNKYSTYFRGFFTNRTHIFIGNKKGSISYRLIDENLGLFLENINNFQKLISTDLINEKILQDNYDLFIQIIKFNDVLTQEGIDKYNAIIGGIKGADYEEKGINVLINLYNQKYNDKIPLLKPLFKQILSDRKSLSFVLDVIENDNEIFDLIDGYLESNNFINYFSNSNLNINEIYIENKTKMSTLSNEMFGNWNEIPLALDDWYIDNISDKVSNKTFIAKRDKYFKDKKMFSIKELSDLNLVNNKFIEFFKDKVDKQIEMITENIMEYQKLKEYNIENLKGNKEFKKVIKNLLDAILNYERFLKQFELKDKTLQKDPEFYNEFDLNYFNIKEINDIYNKIRNYIVKKPFNISKFKINFGKSTLLDGWDIDKEKDNLGVMFKKYNEEISGYKYYLGVLNDNKIFENIEETTDSEYYEKMEYKLIPDPNMQLPRMFIIAKNYKEQLSQDFLKKYEEKRHTKANLDKEFLTEYITYLIKNLNERYSEWFDFKFKEPFEYNSVDEFYRDVEVSCYFVRFKRISDNYINDCIENDKLYLFELYSKDFSKDSKGLPNNQTIYLKSLFSEENLINNVFKLNGQAEIFFREKSIERKVTHKANERIKNKNKDNKKEYSVFNYDLIKNKRYTEDKFLFHFPITLNFKSKRQENINQYINDNITDFKHIIGIDRGERNLIYLVVIDLEGNIVDQISLNEIIYEHKGNEYITDYHHLLKERAQKRKDEKHSWEQTETIKELKMGYISQVVNKVNQLVLKHNGLVVLENLNFGFKNNRKKVDAQVYQMFETQLIKKFNYVINKRDSKTYLNGLQLTNKFTTLDKIYSQSGIVFYIPAWKTSDIDPTTGFVNLLYRKKYKNIEDSKEFIKKIKDIRFNGKYYEFDIDFNDFNLRYKNTKTDWTICTYSTRIINRRLEKSKGWESVEYDLTTEFTNLFIKYNIYSNYKVEVLKINDAQFFKDFLYFFQLALQIRNSEVNSDVDYILSPVKNKDNLFFDSREQVRSLPKDADANGAYNIARKGLMLYNRIKDNPQDTKNNYKITNEDYLNYLQNK